MNIILAIFLMIVFFVIGFFLGVRSGIINAISTIRVTNMSLKQHLPLNMQSCALHVCLGYQ